MIGKGVGIMQVRGIVQRAELVEKPPGSDRIEIGFAKGSMLQFLLD